MVEYALEILNLAAEGGWNKPAMKAVFQKGLNTDLLTEIAWRNEAADLDALIDLAISLNNLLLDQCSKKLKFPLPPAAPTNPCNSHSCLTLKNVKCEEGVTCPSVVPVQIIRYTYVHNKCH